MELLSELKTLITNSTKESIQQAKDIASENQLNVIAEICDFFEATLDDGSYYVHEIKRFLSANFEHYPSHHLSLTPLNFIGIVMDYYYSKKTMFGPRLPDSIGCLQSLTSFACDGCFDELPIGFAKLTNLKKLDLSQNKMKEFPEMILRFKKLEHLDLSLNSEITEIPDGIENLKKLKILKLGYNDIEELPQNIGLLSDLEEIRVQGNKLKAIPASFGLLTKLKKCDFSENAISGIPQELKNLDQLESVNFSDNPLSTEDELFADAS